MSTKNYSRVLPVTPWTAASPWSLQLKPLGVLVLSLAAFGIGDGMLVAAQLGSAPWTVLAQGLAGLAGLGLGKVTFAVSAAVMLCWIPLKIRPGLGTFFNMAVIAAALGLFVHFVPPPQAWWLRALFCTGGIAVIGTASAFYLTCHMGPGPRDGLMVGLCAKTGLRIGTVRTALEIAVCALGWLLGGTVGIGTLLFAFGVGWVVQWVVNLLAARLAQAV